MFGNSSDLRDQTISSWGQDKTDHVILVELTTLQPALTLFYFRCIFCSKLLRFEKLKKSFIEYNDQPYRIFRFNQNAHLIGNFSFGNDFFWLPKYSRILKNNDSVVFLITKNRVEYSGVIFRSILDFWKQNGVFV